MIKFDTTKLKPEHFKEAGFVTAAEIGPNNEHIFTYINDDYAEQLEQDNIDTDKIGAYATYEFISSHYNYEQDRQLFYIVPAPDCKDGPYTDFIAVLFDKGVIDVIIYEGLSLYKSMAAVLCDNSYNSVHTAEKQNLRPFCPVLSCQQECLHTSVRHRRPYSLSQVFLTGIPDTAYLLLSLSASAAARKH